MFIASGPVISPNINLWPSAKVLYWGIAKGIWMVVKAFGWRYWLIIIGVSIMAGIGRRSTRRRF